MSPSSSVGEQAFLQIVSLASGLTATQLQKGRQRLRFPNNTAFNKLSSSQLFSQYSLSNRSPRKPVSDPVRLPSSKADKRHRPLSIYIFTTLLQVFHYDVQLLRLAAATTTATNSSALRTWTFAVAVQQPAQHLCYDQCADRLENRDCVSFLQALQVGLCEREPAVSRLAQLARSTAEQITEAHKTASHLTHPAMAPA